MHIIIIEKGLHLFTKFSFTMYMVTGMHLSVSYKYWMCSLRHLIM